MSKMSQLAMELDEQAAEMGYESYQAALNAGCEVVDNRLLNPMEATHRSLLRSKEEILNDLDFVITRTPEEENKEKLRKVEKFIQEEVK